MVDKNKDNNEKKSDLNTNQNFFHNQNSSKIVSPTGLDRRGWNVNNSQNYNRRSDYKDIEDEVANEEVIQEELQNREEQLENNTSNQTGGGFKGLVKGLFNSGKDKAKSEVKSKVIKVVLAKYKWIILAVIAGLFLIVIVVFAVASGGGSTMSGMSFNDVSQYKLNLKTEDPEYYQDFWEDTYESNIEPSNKKFYRRFNRAYNSWKVRLNTQEEWDVLDASKMHLLSALFLDYSPDNFNSDINKWAAGGELDNIYLNDETSAYLVCDNETFAGQTANDNDEGCADTNKNLIDSDYEVNGLKDMIDLLANAVLSVVDKFQNYLDDKDTIRALGRHFFVYETSCEMEKIVIGTNGKREKITSTYNYPKVYTFEEVLKMMEDMASKGGLYSGFPEYQNCKGEDNQWLKDGWEKTTFNLGDTIDICAFYKYLVESDYFEKHAHFKSEFQNIWNYIGEKSDYALEASKLKIGLAQKIIDIVTLSNEYDPIYNSSNLISKNGTISYSLSEDLYITTTNSSTSKNGHVTEIGSWPLDQYVEGVVDDEVLGAFYGSGEDEASIYTALQANAIAIRSYTLAVTNQGQKTISNSSGNQNFTDQYLKNNDKKFALARSATLSTANQILVENNEVIMAEYSSFSKNNYYRANDLCYSTYTKIGKSSTGATHTVIAKCKWGLAYGHHRGMSQWGSLYLATLGYSYQDILADFYADNVSIANYDYSRKDVGSIAEGEYGIKESMMVCDLFTSAEYSSIKQALGNLATLEIPLRTTSSKYENFYDDGTGGGSGEYSSEYNGLVLGTNPYAPVLRSCEWNVNKFGINEDASLLYRCDPSKTFGYVTGFSYAAGEGSYNDSGYEYWSDDNDKQTDGLSVAVAAVMQNFVNTYKAGGGMLTSGGCSNAHKENDVGYDACDLGASAVEFSYFYNTLPDNQSISYETDENGNPVFVDGELQYKNVVDGESSTFTQKSIPKAIKATGRKEEKLTDPKMRFYSAVDYRTAELIVKDKKSFYGASKLYTTQYAWVDDISKYPESWREFYVTEIPNVLEATNIANNNLPEMDFTVKKVQGSYINLTAIMGELYNFAQIPGVANLAAENTEVQHWQNVCNYENVGNVGLDYCCNGLRNTNDDFASFKATTVDVLGGVFTDAWKMEYCTGTLEGKLLIKRACKSALNSQEAARKQCISTETDENGNPILDENGSPKTYWDVKKTALNVTYNPADYGGSSSTSRLIPATGECPCGVIYETTE